MTTPRSPTSPDSKAPPVYVMGHSPEEQRRLDEQGVALRPNPRLECRDSRLECRYPRLE